MAETGARVPIAPAALSRAGVVTGRPVRGGPVQWGAWADQANHLLGRGGAIIPWATVDNELAIGATHTLRFKVFPRYQATHRRWIVALSTTGAGGRVWGTFTDPSGGTTGYDLSGTTVRYITHDETISSRTASEAELAPTFSLDASSTKTARVVALACFEAPRTELTLDANDLGVSLPTLNAGAEILDGAAGYSVGAIADAVAAAETVAQRNGLFHFARHTTLALSMASGSWTTIFAPPLLGRPVYRSATTKTVELRARCRADALTSGSLRFTMTSGGTTTLTITSGMAATWLTGTIAIDCEDFSDDAYGRRSSRFDKCTIDWQRTGGAGSIYLESISILKG